MAHSAGRGALPEAAQAPAAAGVAGGTGDRSPSGADPEKRRRILEAAIRTFGRRGFHEARVAEIAAAAKVAEGTVYLYFRNKEDLLGVVFDESMDDVLAKGRAIARSKGPAAGRLTDLVDLHLQFIGSDRDLASVFQIELRRSARLVERFSRSKLVEYFRLLGEVLRDGIAKGEFRRDLDPRLAVRILFGASDEILSEWLLSGEKRPSADAKQLVGALLKGFANSPSKHAPKARTTGRKARLSHRRPRSKPEVSKSAFILHGARTPFARAGTDFTGVSAVDLGRTAAVEAMARSLVEPAEIDQVIFGNISTPVDAANIARVISLRAGVPKEKPAHSVSRNCASGIESVVEAARLIATGEAEVVLAGGVENMTQIPFLYRNGVKEVFTKAGMSKTAGERISAFSKMPWKDLFNPVIGLKEGLTDPVCDLGMGDTAEILAKEGRLTREVQDAFALRSHHRAFAARAKLAEEIVPVPVPPDYDRVLTFDNGVRENQTMEALAKLRPFFDRKFGTVTAGNSSQITDGGAAVVVASEEYVEKHNLKPLGRISGWGFAGLEPERMGLGPSRSTPIALKRAGLTMKDVGLVEINEAFAAQVLANLAAFAESPELGPIADENLNVNGGAIALGHPVGCSGTRLILTLLLEMRRRQVAHGLATLCVGGGQGASILLEAV